MLYEITPHGGAVTLYIESVLLPKIKIKGLHVLDNPYLELIHKLFHLKNTHTESQRFICFIILIY